MSPTLVIILVGCLVAASCALIGSFLVLRRMALLGDAVSHAVLPGIAIAFLLTGQRSALPMVLGAGALGVVTVFLVGVLDRSRRIHSDASIGVVFPALFSIGVILISRFASQIDLDLDCVLYGEIAFAPWNTLTLAGRSLGPKALWVMGIVLALNVALVVGFWKELKLSTFDPELSAAAGFSPVFLHYLLMSAVSVTVVGAFESVGAILVVAMLVVPPAAAYLLTESLGRMILIAIAIGIGAAVSGYGFARWYDCSIAGGMAVAAGALFMIALLASPHHGLIHRAITHRRLALRLSGQLLLLHLKHGGAAVSREAIERRFGWSDRQLRRVLEALTRGGFVEISAEGVRLTESGALEIERSGAAPLVHGA
jgi:manganese/zinc/iron transport system permease protein